MAFRVVRLTPSMHDTPIATSIYNSQQPRIRHQCDIHISGIRICLWMGRWRCDGGCAERWVKAGVAFRTAMSVLPPLRPSACGFPSRVAQLSIATPPQKRTTAHARMLRAVTVVGNLDARPIKPLVLLLRFPPPCDASQFIESACKSFFFCI